jgi:hypothetical protein
VGKHNLRAVGRRRWFELGTAGRWRHLQLRPASCALTQHINDVADPPLCLEAHKFNRASRSSHRVEQRSRVVKFCQGYPGEQGGAQSTSKTGRLADIVAKWRRRRRSILTAHGPGMPVLRAPLLLFTLRFSTLITLLRNQHEGVPKCSANQTMNHSSWPRIDT